MSATVHAQSDSLQVRYEQLMDRSETYLKYKVVSREDLNTLWSEVQDSIGSYQDQLGQQQAEIAQLNQALAERANTIESLETQADDLSGQVDSIGFLGITFSKGSYHTLVWGIIVLLIVAVVVIYSMTLRSRIVTKTTTSDLKALQAEYEEYKERARAREVKVKRELQTAVNNLEEFKRGVKK